MFIFDDRNRVATDATEMCVHVIVGAIQPLHSSLIASQQHNKHDRLGMIRQRSRKEEENCLMSAEVGYTEMVVYDQQASLSKSTFRSFVGFDMIWQWQWDGAGEYKTRIYKKNGNVKQKQTEAARVKLLLCVREFQPVRSHSFYF